MKKETLLVTGGAGYIGSHIVKLLGENGYNLVILDNLSTGFADAVLFGELIIGDLADDEKLKKIFQQFDFSGVFHFAGSIVVPESVRKPLDYYTNNTLNSLNLIKKCVEFNVPSFVFSSTAAVYGELESGVAFEHTPTEPINPYGQSKLMTEKMLKDASFAHEHFNYTALRYFNVSGAESEGNIGQAFPGATHLIKVCCEAAAGKRDGISLFGQDYPTPDGTCLRDYIHVMDLAQAHLDAFLYMQKEKSSQVFNCGYGNGRSVQEVISAVKDVTKKDFRVEKVPRREGDPALLVANSDLLKEKTGWTPRHQDLREIISTAYKWEQGERLSEWHRKRQEALG